MKVETGIKVIGAVAAAIVLALIVLGAAQRKAEDSIATLREQAAAAKAEAAHAKREKEAAQQQAAASAEEAQRWRQAADKLVAHVGQLESRLKGVEGKLAQLGPARPATDPAALPADTTGLAAAFTVEGFPPTVGTGPAPLAFTPAQGQPMLGLLKDGREYPKALERLEATQEQVGILQEQKTGLADALQARTREAAANLEAYEREREATTAATAESAAKDVVVKATRQQVVEKGRQLKAERAKKWIWGGTGLGIALLSLLL